MFKRVGSFIHTPDYEKAVIRAEKDPSITNISIAQEILHAKIAENDMRIATVCGSNKEDVSKDVIKYIQKLVGKSNKYDAFLNRVMNVALHICPEYNYTDMKSKRAPVSEL
ncbi:hypothetical protein [Enterobacter sp. 22466]|uniref:hypothetical protein n=1 Tax=Enterobacter sp. 22466 TaxID=3453924 RepID=UPI003F824DD5